MTTKNECGKSTLVRPRFSPGLLLQDDDLTAAVDYVGNLSRLLFKSLFGCGIICGFKICPVSTNCGLNVTVKKGLGFDCQGNPVELPDDQTIGLGSCSNPNATELWVAIKRKEWYCMPRDAVCAPEDDNGSTQVTTRIRDAWELKLLDKWDGCGCGCKQTPPPASQNTGQGTPQNAASGAYTNPAPASAQNTTPGGYPSAGPTSTQNLTSGGSPGTTPGSSQNTTPGVYPTPSAGSPQNIAPVATQTGAAGTSQNPAPGAAASSTTAPYASGPSVASGPAGATTPQGTSTGPAGTTTPQGTATGPQPPIYSDPTDPCYKDHYEGTCACDCSCEWIVLGRISQDANGTWNTDYRVRRVVRPVLIRDHLLGP
jgi:hypothetical protein